jgi:hypothetical protein
MRYDVRERPDDPKSSLRKVTKHIIKAFTRTQLQYLAFYGILNLWQIEKY